MWTFCCVVKLFGVVLVSDVVSGVVFFFKQKTAYEMRISDWSSDVCSSDLLIGDAPLSPEDGLDAIETAETIAGMAATRRLLLDDRRLVGILFQWRLEEIGRASCRERVCQYV